MEKLMILPLILLFSCSQENPQVPGYINEVDQVIWVVEDLEDVMADWKNLGFSEIVDLGTVQANLKSSDEPVPIHLAKANLGGAHIIWIQPLEENSVFARFHEDYGDGAMSLVHDAGDKTALNKELKRLSALGIGLLDEVTIELSQGALRYALMDTRKQGKYILGYTWSKPEDTLFMEKKGDNIHGLQINQYAFAIRDPEPVSDFWEHLGQPEFQINHPVLGNMHYYGEPTDHELIQGWQRHGTVAYEWCIPVKLPIVYDDHIRIHGEGIHHLAFKVNDMDAVLRDYGSKGYVNSMGGTWGEEGKPGSGRYEYIDLEEAGGVTVELLWSYPSKI
jgi:hypothetical protein